MCRVVLLLIKQIVFNILFSHHNIHTYISIGGNVEKDCRMKTDYKINLSPTQLDLEKVKDWLVEEEIKFNEGFNCNWEIIEKTFKNGDLITLDFNEIPIGFLVWSKGEIYAEIDILEIRPAFRNKGIGRFFYSQICDYLRQNGYLAVKLFCAPIKSERFWKKMGFIKFPYRGYSEADLTYFKPLIEILPTSENGQKGHKIELWDVEPFQKNNNIPKWTWSIELIDNVLISPIIQPCNCNWNLRWTKNGETLKEDKVKYFGTKENRVDYSPFLCIEKLIE